MLCNEIRLQTFQEKKYVEKYHQADKKNQLRINFQR